MLVLVRDRVEVQLWAALRLVALGVAGADLLGKGCHPIVAALLGGVAHHLLLGTAGDFSIAQIQVQRL